MSTDNQIRTPIVGIGASAGGLEALRELFEGFQGRPGVSFVVVQHLDPDHDSLMAQLLERYTQMEVKQASGGEVIEGDHVYVIPPGHGLAIENGKLELTEFTDPRGLRRPIDDFFESLAIEVGTRAACVILSGTGGDGSRGLRAIKEYGGVALVQEPGTARYDGMPVSAISTGLVDIVLPPGEIIGALRNFFDRADDIELAEAKDAADHIDEMCASLRHAVGHDFSGYKRSTLSRRIARRMQVIDTPTSEEYLERLKNDPDECQALFRDLLINVTRFFRDREEFADLEQMVIDPMIARSRDSHEIRIWVAGCSSGEEAYSIAMLVADAMARHERRPYVQIFATDIDDKMLDIARHATYPIAALPDIPLEYQSAYLDVGMEHFSIVPRIRDMVRISAHNLVRDPPYSKINLLSCRNLLIYFDEHLQREVMPAFHFSLVDKGKLFLGSSESVGRFDDLFSTVNQRSRIFERRNTPARYSLNFSAKPLPRRRSTAETPPIEHSPMSLDIAALTKLAQRHAPVSILVDSEGNILNQWGAVSRYLVFPDRGDDRDNLLRLAKAGLREILGPMLREAGLDRKPRVARDVMVQTDFGVQPLTVMIDPVAAGAYLVVCRETGNLEQRAPDDFEDYQRGHGELQYLQDELHSARLKLRTTVEELETANEELKSSNEEMMSMNEELQSTNEELTTVNDELKAKVDQVTTANTDLKNFFDSTELVVLVVDRDLHLRSATDVADKLFNITPAHIGAALRTLPTRLADRDYLEHAAQVAESGNPAEYLAQTEDGEQQYMVRILPYRMLDGSITGATLLFTDVTKILHLESELSSERARLRLALEVAGIGIWEYEPGSDRLELDDNERYLLGIEEDVDGDSIEPILARLPKQDRDRVTRALREAMDGDQTYDETFRIGLPGGGVRWLHGLGKRIDSTNGGKFIGVTYDVTAEREQLAHRELMLREMNHRMKNLFAVITALTKMSARHAEDIDSYVSQLCERIHALGRSHSITVQSASGTADLHELIETALKPSADGCQVSLEGVTHVLTNRMITPLAMILHEWVTNSSKHGAIGCGESGSISIKTSVGDDGHLKIDWREAGKSPTADAVGGFGTHLVQASAKQLHGRTTAQATDGGYHQTLTFPTDR